MSGGKTKSGCFRPAGPSPPRPRDLLELLVALGDTASMQSLTLSADFREAEPRSLTYLALGRWPTSEELAAQSVPYQFSPHLRALLVGQEFRDSLFRRVCDAYQERQRLFYVRIPRCAGTHFLATTAPMHPLFDFKLAQWRRGRRPGFHRRPGHLSRPFQHHQNHHGRHSVTAQRHRCAGSAAPCRRPPSAGRSTRPPCRAGDRLFAILREPRSLLLSLVNAQAARLTEGPSKDTATYLKHHARRLLRELTDRNPLCTALGNGTAEATLALCRLTDIELADLGRYPAWIRYSWDTDAEPPVNASTPGAHPRRS